MRALTLTQPWADVVEDHDPGDEDRRPILVGPWCERCGDAFDAPERPCPRPAPGRPYYECGRGGHMFRLEVEPSPGWWGWLS